MNIKTSIPESEQESSFMNATLHSVTERIACSLAITPKYPDHVKTEQQASVYLESSLQVLKSLGWGVDVQIGPSADYEGVRECTNPTCKADLTKPESVTRQYYDKDDAENTIDSEGHYENGEHFESDDHVSLGSGRFDIADDSDKCTNCNEQL